VGVAKRVTAVREPRPTKERLLFGGDFVYQIWQGSRTDRFDDVGVAAGGDRLFSAVALRVKRNRQYRDFYGARVGSQSTDEGQTIGIRKRQVDNNHLRLLAIDGLDRLACGSRSTDAMAGRTEHDVDQLQMQRVIFYGQNFNGRPPFVG